MHWYIDVLRKYFGFDGRARRSEYWMFALISSIIFGGFAVIDYLTGTWNAEFTLGVTSGIYLLAVLLPSIAVTVRRLHDTDRTGWWMLIGIVPLIGPIVMFIFTVLDSTPGPNRYGPNPKGT